MANDTNWLDELLAQVAEGRMLPQDALQHFFLHKKRAGDAILTDEDQAFISAMDTVEVAQLAAKWCARNAAIHGPLAAIEADLRRPTFFHPRRRPPLITGTTPSGQRLMLFSADDGGAQGEYAEDCLRAAGCFSAAAIDPAFLPVFTSALTTALKGHGLPEPTFIR